jgi:hypothetical protein
MQKQTTLLVLAVVVLASLLLTVYFDVSASGSADYSDMKTLTNPHHPHLQVIPPSSNHTHTLPPNETHTSFTEYEIHVYPSQETHVDLSRENTADLGELKPAKLHVVTWLRVKTTGPRIEDLSTKVMSKLRRLIGSIRYFHPEADVSLYLILPSGHEGRNTFAVGPEIGQTLSWTGVFVYGIDARQFRSFSDVIEHVKETNQGMSILMLPISSYLTSCVPDRFPVKEIAFEIPFQDGEHDMVVSESKISFAAVLLNGEHSTSFFQDGSPKLESYPMGTYFPVGNEVSASLLKKGNLFNLVRRDDAKQVLIFNETDDANFVHAQEIPKLGFKQSIFELKGMYQSQAGVRLVLEDLHRNQVECRIDISSDSEGIVLESCIIAKASEEFQATIKNERLSLSAAGNPLEFFIDYYEDEPPQQYRNPVGKKSSNSRSSISQALQLEDKKQDDGISSIGIALLVPAMSTSESSLAEAPIFTDFIPSLTETISNSSMDEVPQFHYKIFLGVNSDDYLFANISKRFELYTMFENLTSGYPVELEIFRFNNFKGAPARIWTALAWKAYVENYDFLYQANDDLSFQTTGKITN